MGHGRIVFDGTLDGLRADQKVRKEWLEVYAAQPCCRQAGHGACPAWDKPQWRRPAFFLQSKSHDRSFSIA